MKNKGGKYLITSKEYLYFAFSYRPEGMEWKGRDDIHLNIDTRHVYRYCF
jgi:hypothetical protein